MYQDKNGLLWLATDCGVQGFDGDQFIELSRNNLVKGGVYRFYPDPQGKIWFITSENKLFWFTPDEYTVHPYAFNEKLSRLSSGGTSNDVSFKDGVKVAFWNRLGYVHIGKNGEIKHKPHIRSNTKVYVYCFDDNDRFTYIDNVEGRPGEIIDTLNENGGYHYSSYRKQHVVISNFYKTKLFHNGKPIIEIDSGSRPLSHGFLSDTTFWVGYLNGGIHIYNTRGEKIHSFGQDVSATYLLNDFQGAYWVSSLNKGLRFYSSFNLKVFNSMEEPNIRRVFSSKKYVYAACLNGDLIKVSDSSYEYFAKSTTGTHSYFFPKFNENMFYLDIELHNYPGKLNAGIYRKSYDNDTIALLGTTGGVFQELRNNRVKRHQLNKNHPIEGLCVYNNQVLIALDRELYYYDIFTEKQTLIYTSQDKITATNVYNDLIFLGTETSGIIVLKNGKAIAKIKQKDGITSSQIKEIEIENLENIWVATRDGASRITWPFKKENVLNINSVCGLVESEVNDIAIRGNVVYLATVNGLVYFEKDISFNYTNRTNLMLRSTGVDVLNNPNTDLLNLNYNENELVLNFQAVSLTPGTRVRYRYKINNDKNWHLTNTKSIHLRSLTPGSYKVVVQAGLSGHWDDRFITYNFTIHPPFYKTTWFVLIVCVLASLLIYLFFKLNILKYNRHITREILRRLLKLLTKSTKEFMIEDGQRKVRIDSNKILYIKASKNYVEIVAENKKVIVRQKISDMLNIVPDPLEYLRVHRSYIVRVDKVTSLQNNFLEIEGYSIKIGSNYKEAGQKIEEVMR